MSITVNSCSCVPPGFRFHPTEEELLNYYLTKKVSSEKIDMDVIRDVDLNKLEPWDIQEKCRIGSTPQNDWYFFSHKDKKYPTGTRTNRATAAGFWKATGRDKVIHTSFRRIGMRKTLVFYRGRAPNGQRSDWIMHEYRLDDQLDANSHSNASSSIEEMAAQEDGWVVCRVFKKNLNKALDSPNNCSSITSDAKAQMMHSSSDGALDQILQYIGRSYKQETEVKSIMGISNNPKNWSSNSNLNLLRPIDTIFCNDYHEIFMKLPALESTPLPSLPIEFAPTHDHTFNEQAYIDGVNMDTSWIASQFSGQSEVSKQLAYSDNPGFPLSSFNWLLAGSQDYYHHSGNGDGDLWSFTS